jgi:alcohol dehydrogenase class IV
MVSFVLPRKIIYKGDSLEELLNLTSSFSLKNILIITDKVIRNIDYFKRIEEGLNKNGLNLMVYYDVNPEPNIETVNSIYDFIKGEKVDLIVAIGGGSVIDVSKLLRAKILRPDIRSEDISPFISLIKRPCW